MNTDWHGGVRCQAHGGGIGGVLKPGFLNRYQASNSKDAYRDTSEALQTLQTGINSIAVEEKGVDLRCGLQTRAFPPVPKTGTSSCTSTSVLTLYQHQASWSIERC